MATSSGINTGYEPTEADLCITKSWQRDQVMGITIMVQTKKEFIIIPKCTIAMLSNPHFHKKKIKMLSNPLLSSTYYCQIKKIKIKIKNKNKKREEEKEAKPPF